MGKGHGVGFVAHAYALQAVLPRVFKRIADDALDAFAGVDILLDSDLVRCVLLEEATDSHVQPLGVLAENHQADVFFGAVAQGSEPVVKQLDGPGVNVEVQLEAQPKQDVGGMLIRRHARVSERAKKNGIKLVPQHLYCTRGQRDAFPEVLFRAPIEFHEFQRPLGGSSHGLQHFHGFWSDFRTNPIAWDHSDASRWTTISQRNSGQCAASSTTDLPAARRARYAKRPGAILPSKRGSRHPNQISAYIMLGLTLF